MTANPFNVIARHIPFAAVAAVLLVCFSAPNGAQGSRISLSTSPLDTRSAPIIQYSQMLELDSEDIFLLSARDISPDVIATEVPAPSFAHRSRGARLHPENKVLPLRSSLRNVSGLDGFTLQSLPILVSELADLLSQTRADLQNHGADFETSSYQFKSKKWSFSVVTADPPVHAQRRHNQQAHPILHLWSTAQQQNTPPDQPTEILSVTPSGSTCIYRTVNESAALSPFSTTPWTHQSFSTNLQPRSFETEILTRLSQTAFSLSYRLLRDGNGLPTMTPAWTIKGIIFIAVWQTWTLLNKTATQEQSAQQKQEQELKLLRLDTQMFEIAQMNVRFVAEITRRDGNGSAVELALRNWWAISMMLADPVRALKALTDVWAMEGEIYGPADGGGGELGDSGIGRNSSSGNSSQVPLGRWELYVGGKEEL